MEAFSDGVFAFALTLLVLGLRDPTVGSSSSLLQGLLEEWPVFLAFGISFTTIFVMWVNHHNLFTYIRRIDAPFMFLNGLLLLCATLIPFTTSLVANHVLSADSGTAAQVYCGLFLFVALAWNLLWQYTIRHPGNTLRQRQPERNNDYDSQFIFGPTLYIVAFAAAFFSGLTSLFIILIVLALYAFFAAETRIRGRSPASSYDSS